MADYDEHKEQVSTTPKMTAEQMRKQRLDSMRFDDLPTVGPKVVVNDRTETRVRADERYYPTSQYNQFRESTDPELGLAPNKPEGVPSEIADIVIRCFDFASEAGFDLGEAIDEKLEYNGTRGFRHGNKAL